MARTRTEPDDRLIIELNRDGPIEVEDLSSSFAALGRYYERYYQEARPGEVSQKLFITRIATGSIITEIAPYAVLFGSAYAAMGAAITVGDFAKRFGFALKVFSDPERFQKAEPILSRPSHPSRDDATDLQDFIRPLTGKRGASLGIKHARFRQADGGRETIVEFRFDEREINRAAANIGKLESSDFVDTIERAAEDLTQRTYHEVMLFFQQVSKAPSKERGRTSDRAIVPDISDKPLPTYSGRTLTT